MKINKIINPEFYGVLCHLLAFLGLEIYFTVKDFCQYGLRVIRGGSYT